MIEDCFQHSNHSPMNFFEARTAKNIGSFSKRHRQPSSFILALAHESPLPASLAALDLKTK